MMMMMMMMIMIIIHLSMHFTQKHLSINDYIGGAIILMIKK